MDNDQRLHAIAEQDCDVRIHGRQRLRGVDTGTLGVLNYVPIQRPTHHVNACAPYQVCLLLVEAMHPDSQRRAWIRNPGRAGARPHVGRGSQSGFQKSGAGIFVVFLHLLPIHGGHRTHRKKHKQT
ncbi:MAG: hypothetical protein WAX69_06625 [Victivallales bacterium]